MGVANLAAICGRLAEHGMDPATPAAAIQWGTTPRQKTVAGTLATLAGEVAKAGLGAPAVIVVGEVVRLRESLAWFERRPLFGRRIVITRSRAQASQLSAALEELGAEAVEAPTIRIEPPEDPGPLRAAMARAAEYDWIVLTSTNGAVAAFDALEAAGLDARALAGVRIASIGPATAAALAARGIRADVQPAAFTSTAVVKALAECVNLQGLRILLPRADIAPPDMVKALAERGATVEEVAAYRTVADDAGLPRVAAMLERGEVDWLTFTSSSTVRNFLAGAGAERVRASGVRVASIGPTTSATLREAGIKPTVEADPHTIPGLVAAMVACETQRKGTS
jgi:uroporphyrinogen III methyltransferase/synthase